MQGEGDGPGSRYRAFISYSHADAAFGRMLHRKLESYRIPSRLVGKETARGRVPARLAPIFRDREELAAADDLSAEVKAALGSSACLIIVCSPHSKASPWVAREIELFRSLHGEMRPVLAALIEGEPKDCFPDPLHRATADGLIREPIAADFRKTGDGKKLALLKLVAGITGLDLDALVQRDAQRRFRSVIAVTVAALLALLVTGLLLVMALKARTEAEVQRAKAEGLIEFMLTDLRDGLRDVGRTDIMKAVDRRAFLHYGDRDDPSLPASSRGLRARILLAAGEDASDEGHAAIARARFAEAYRITQILLMAAPNDPDRVFNHAQGEYWLGYADYGDSFDSRGQVTNKASLASAMAHFNAYRELASRLVTLRPDNPRYVRELGYAEGNLCAVTIAPPSDPPEARHWCAAALGTMERAATRLGPGSGIETDVANRHAWLADAWKVSGNLPKAFEERVEEQRIVDGLLRREPKNMDHKDLWVTLQYGLAQLELLDGRRPAAKRRVDAALPVADALLRHDPDNKLWAAHARRLTNLLAN